MVCGLTLAGHRDINTRTSLKASPILYCPLNLGIFNLLSVTTKKHRRTRSDYFPILLDDPLAYNPRSRSWSIPFHLSRNTLLRWKKSLPNSPLSRSHLPTKSPSPRIFLRNSLNSRHCWKSRSSSFPATIPPPFPMEKTMTLPAHPL